jgi:hypothetical protein
MEADKIRLQDILGHIFFRLQCGLPEVHRYHCLLMGNSGHGEKVRVDGRPMSEPLTPKHSSPEL